jgi:hypothetical protein
MLVFTRDGSGTGVFNDLIDDFTKSDFKSFWDDFEIFEIALKYGDLI